MLEKYINKNVIVIEKTYQGFSSKLLMGNKSLATIKGILTSVDDNFIELDNEKLINRNHIYTIKVAK